MRKGRKLLKELFLSVKRRRFPLDQHLVTGGNPHQILRQQRYGEHSKAPSPTGITPCRWQISTEVFKSFPASENIGDLRDRGDLFAVVDHALQTRAQQGDRFRPCRILNVLPSRRNALRPCCHGRMLLMMLHDADNWSSSPGFSEGTRRRCRPARFRLFCGVSRKARSLWTHGSVRGSATVLSRVLRTFNRLFRQLSRDRGIEFCVIFLAKGNRFFRVRDLCGLLGKSPHCQVDDVTVFNSGKSSRILFTSIGTLAFLSRRQRRLLVISHQVTNGETASILAFRHHPADLGESHAGLSR